jgi:hypothetical protein
MPKPRPGSLLLVGALCLLSVTASRGQDLVGCSLVDGQLSCVPGVSSDPQAQIRALRDQISATLAQETAVQQGIDGLESLVLTGEALEGSLLQATLASGEISNLPESSYHWYRLSPGSSHWIWIDTAQGPSYRLGTADRGSEVMVVVVAVEGTGIKRQASPPVGPVGAAGTEN